MRADVEQLLGSAKGFFAGKYDYETKAEKVKVVYSEGACKSILEGKWNVPADTLLSNSPSPNNRSS
jgi:hypothetical protein